MKTKGKVKTYHYVPVELDGDIFICDDCKQEIVGITLPIQCQMCKKDLHEQCAKRIMFLGDIIYVCFECYKKIASEVETYNKSVSDMDEAYENLMRALHDNSSSGQSQHHKWRIHF
jgi:hypothetical protein